MKTNRFLFLFLPELRENSPYAILILASVIILTLSGLILNMSASTAYAEYYFDRPFYFGIRHLIFLIVGFLVMWAATILPLSFWRKHSLLFLLISVVLVSLVFFDGIGKSVNASSRWLDLSFFSVQPAEILKFTLPLFLSAYLSRRTEQLENGWQPIVVVLVVVGFVNFLLLLQPDFGGLVLLSLMAVTLLFFSGMRWGHLIFLSLAGTGLFFLLTVIQPYRLDRLRCLTDENVWNLFFDKCYQIGHSIIAIERGGLFGRGPGESIQKYFYLPEAYTDFIFSIMAEEWGFLICLLLLGLFGFMCVCVLLNGVRMIENGQQFAGYLLCGISVLWISQTLINVGVSLGYFPITGMSLPFFSYGGSSLMVNMFLTGICIRCLTEDASFRAQAEAQPL